MDLRFRKTLSAAEVEQSVDRLEEEIRKRHPDVKHVFIESDSLPPSKQPRKESSVKTSP
jgi:divalent metal cation (Fe/Co/Zn/Cd) transporter